LFLELNVGVGVVFFVDSFVYCDVMSVNVLFMGDVMFGELSVSV